MDLDQEAVRLAHLKMANARALQNPMNVYAPNPVAGGYEGGAFGDALFRDVLHIPKPKRKGRGVAGGGKKKKQNVDFIIEEKGKGIAGAGIAGAGKKKSKKQGKVDKTDESFAMKAHKLGQEYAKAISQEDPSVKELVGSGFWSDFYDGFKKGFFGTARVVGKIAKAIPVPEAQAVGAVGDVIDTLGKATGNGVAGAGKRKKRQPSARMKKRGALVSKLMKEEGMTLGQASKYIKEHNLM